MSWLAIAVGASLGAWLRYALGLFLNPALKELPLGTLAANLGGGFMIGLAVAFFGTNPNISPAWRLFIITGFMGGLTTFSSFSAESMNLLHNGEYGWALAHTAIHVLGSLACCFAGYASYKALA